MARPLSDGVRELEDALADPAAIHRVVISGRRKGFQPDSQRIDISPVLLRDELKLKIVRHTGVQDFTEILSAGQLKIEPIIESGFANVLLEYGDQRVEMKITKRGNLLVHRSPLEIRPTKNIEHDRKKDRLLPPDDEIFIELGISNREGKLIPAKSDKYVQVDQFLRILDTSLDPGWLPGKSVKVVDLGCGNAYLTFATHRFLTIKGFDVSIVGIDRKAESVTRNSLIANRLGISASMSFVQGEISSFANQAADIVIALHACDTATDDALTAAVRSNASIVLVSPCCHHHLNAQIKNSADDSELHQGWRPILRHGITRERLADLITDGIRAQVLRILGYRTEIIEFVAGEHTARNLLIRALKRPTPFADLKVELSELELLMRQWRVEPYITDLLKAELDVKREDARLS